MAIIGWSPHKLKVGGALSSDMSGNVHTLCCVYNASHDDAGSLAKISTGGATRPSFCVLFPFQSRSWFLELTVATGGACPFKRAPPSALQVVPLLCRLAGQALRRQRSPPGRQVRGEWSSTVWHGNGCADLARRGTWPSRGLCADVDCSQMRFVVPICMSMYYAKPILNCGPSSSAKPIILNLILAVVSQT